jgi:hypothetical protein
MLMIEEQYVVPGMAGNFSCRNASQLEEQRELHVLRLETLSYTRWTKHGSPFVASPRA